MIRFLSICSGIEAASVAWKPLGWKAVGFAEIEPFPSEVLAHHYPEVPNFGDMTKFEEWKIDEPVDLVCGGTPCQAFSVAGKRGGMDDARGQLSLKFVEIVARHRPRWVVWENVPGVFSSGGGADFGSFLGALTGRDVQAPADGWGNSGVLEGIPDAYGVAWRTLDAQHFGVPQRRRRVFVVGHLGDWRRAAAVLFERESLCGHPAPCRKAGEGFTHDVSPCVGASGRGFERGGETRGQDPVVACARMVAFGEYEDDGTASAMKSRDYKDATDLIVSAVPAAGKAGGGEFQRLESSAASLCRAETTHTLRADGFDASEDGTGRGTPLVPMLMRNREGCAGGGKGPLLSPDQSLTLAANANDQVLFQPQAVAFVHQAGGTQTSLGFEPSSETTPTLPKCQTLAVAFAQKQVGEVRTGEVLNTLNTNSNASGRNTPMVAFNVQSQNSCAMKGAGPAKAANEAEVARCLDGAGFTQQQGGTLALGSTMQVRRLTPRECERLQGFPDDYTRIPWRKAAAEDCPDGPRYKALGNSWAVPCARWIGERIQMVEALS